MNKFIILGIIAAVVIFLCLPSTSEKFSAYKTITPGCSSRICSTTLPKFPGVPNLADLPKPPRFSTVQEDVITPTEEWVDPVQWRSPDNTVIIDGYGGIATAGGDNYQFVQGNETVNIEKLPGFDPYSVLMSSIGGTD